MYIIAIAWLYFVIMLAIVSDSLIVGLLRFIFLGAIPAGLLLWMALRRRQAQNEKIKEEAHAKSLDDDALVSETNERPPDSKP
jgi:type VI protein secretion system component VasK